MKTKDNWQLIINNWQFLNIRRTYVGIRQSKVLILLSILHCLEDESERKAQRTVAATESNVAHARAAVGIDIVINNRLGYVSHSLLIAEIKEDARNIDPYTDHHADIERIKFFVNPFLVEVAESDFIMFPP